MAAIAEARRLAAAITAAAPPAGGASAARSLDDVLARDRARIAAADQRNLKYVLDQQANAKAKAKAAEAAKVAAEAAAAAAKAAAAAAPPPEDAAPSAKQPRLSGRSGAGGAAACSVYVCGLPRDVTAAELDAVMMRVVRAAPHASCRTSRLVPRSPPARPSLSGRCPLRPALLTPLALG